MDEEELTIQQIDLKELEINEPINKRDFETSSL